MVLSDKTIKEYLNNGKILIDPIDQKDIQPASVDLHIDKGILIFKNSAEPCIDLRKELPNLTESIEIKKGEPFMLHPGEFVLASTIERVKLSDNVVGRLEGKSSLGRVGLYARTSDGRHTAMYSKKEGKWIRKKGIDSELIIALKIARKELPPSLLKLPIERI